VRKTSLVTMWRTLGTKPLTPEDSTGLVQLLVEVTLKQLVWPTAQPPAAAISGS
jgi:hypothetical protein